MNNFLMNFMRATMNTISNLDDVAKGFNGVVQKIVAPIIACVGVAGTLYAIYLGVMYAKAESADKRKEVQGRLIGAVIGAVIMIAGAVLCFALDWAGIFKNFSFTNTNPGSGTGQSFISGFLG